MSSTATAEQTLEKYLTAKRTVSRKELNGLLELARQHGGELVDVSAFGDPDPDDWCGTMWFHGPRPKVGGLIDDLISRGWTIEVFPRGIINPDALQINVRNQVAGGF
jgi:hypothetical protein